MFDGSFALVKNFWMLRSLYAPPSCPPNSQSTG